MPYTKQTLKDLNALSSEEVEATLSACGLPLDQEEYADQEIETGFRVIREYFATGQVQDYAAATELFRQQSPPQPQTKAPNSDCSKQQVARVSLLDLLAIASDPVAPISLSEASTLLRLCGLPDQEDYTEAEVGRFLEACDLLKHQGKTEAEVAAHFGVSVPSPVAELEYDLRDLRQVGAERSLRLEEIAATLTACGLPEKEKYTQAEYQRFVAARQLFDQGHTPAEVTARLDNHLSLQQHQQIIQQLQQLLKESGGMQADQIRELLPKLSAAQMEEIKVWFNHATLLRLREMAQSGELEAEMRRAWEQQKGKLVGGFGLLPRIPPPPQPRNSLPGSSMS